MKILIAAISLCVLAFLLFKGAEELIHLIIGKNNNRSGVMKTIFRFVSMAFIIINLLMGVALLIWNIVFVIKYQGIDAQIKGIKNALENSDCVINMWLSLVLSLRISGICAFIQLFYCIKGRFKGRLVSNLSLVGSVYSIVISILLIIVEFDPLTRSVVEILGVLLYLIIALGHFSVAFNFRRVCRGQV